MDELGMSVQVGTRLAAGCGVDGCRECELVPDPKGSVVVLAMVDPSDAVPWSDAAQVFGGRVHLVDVNGWPTLALAWDVERWVFDVNLFGFASFVALRQLTHGDVWE